MVHENVNNIICNRIFDSHFWVSCDAIKLASNILQNYKNQFTFGFFSCLILSFSSSQSAYNKVLLANAATSALRLHQRLPAFQLSRAFLSQLFVEDSCHYLLYSFIFMYVSPVFLALVPVVSFAILHASSYSLKLLDVSTNIYPYVFLLNDKN